MSESTANNAPAPSPAAPASGDSGNSAPAAAGAAEGPGIAYESLNRQLTALQKAADGLMELAAAAATRTRNAAMAALELSELVAEAEAPPPHPEAIATIGEAFGTAAGRGARAAGAAEAAGESAGMAKDAHTREYGGIHEAVLALGKRPPKPGFLRQR